MVSQLRSTPMAVGAYIVSAIGYAEESCFFLVDDGLQPVALNAVRFRMRAF